MKRSTLFVITSCFALLLIIFIPFPFNISNIQSTVTEFIFGKLIVTVSQTIFSTTLSNTHVYSDSTSMYILVLWLFILAIVIGLLLPRIKSWNSYQPKVWAFIYQLLLYYLALQLLKYGADKFFKNQFYIPEPNTLFTPVGKIEKDLLYWSAMGTSYSYNLFLGALEILAAVFILIRRTRLVGFLLAFGILLNVVAVNFGFDISVKLFSLLLLFLNLYLLYPYYKRLYQLLLQHKTIHLPVAQATFKRTFVVYFMQWLAVGLIAVEVFYPFIRSGNYNGNNSGKPYLHGAYEVVNIVEGKDTLPAAESTIKRFFIHRDSYIIFQDQQDVMKDYKLAYDKPNSAFIVTDYQLKQTRLSFTYQTTDSILTLQYFNDTKSTTLIGKAINWRKLPLLKKGFHWTTDGMP